MTLKTSICVLFYLFICCISSSEGCKGCVNLDEYNFNKLISRFKVALVKFDIAYPYGDKHDVFTKFADEIADNKNILIAEVGVKDYGEKDNEVLAKRYGIKDKESMPSLRLFVNGITNSAKEFGKNEKWTVDNIRQFVKTNSDIYVGLPGCLEKMDMLAAEFVRSSNKEVKLEEIEKEANQLMDREKTIATTYIKYMKKVLEAGVDFIKSEKERLGKLLKEPKVVEKKKQDLSNRLNILQSFVLSKDEL